VADPIRRDVGSARERRRVPVPQSRATKRPLNEEIAAIAANRPLAVSFYLDTKQEHSRPWPFEGKDHHQGLARTHRLQDGTVYFFLTHSEVGAGEQGQLMQFRYDGPLQGEHIAVSDPLQVAAMAEQIYLDEPHPCDTSGRVSYSSTATATRSRGTSAVSTNCLRSDRPLSRVVGGLRP
jgi:hypothetical protein